VRTEVRTKKQKKGNYLREEWKINRGQYAYAQHSREKREGGKKRNVRGRTRHLQRSGGGKRGKMCTPTKKKKDTVRLKVASAITCTMGNEKKKGRVSGQGGNLTEVRSRRKEGWRKVRRDTARKMSSSQKRKQDHVKSLRRGEDGRN